MALPNAETPHPHNAASYIDAVLFDYGQVLSLPPKPAEWERIRSIAGAGSERFHAAYWKFRHDYDRGALTGATYWRAVADEAGFELDPAKFTALLAADVDLWTNLNQPIVDWALRLQRAGIRTGILSNIGDAIAYGIIARLPWLSGFYHCTWSYALHMAKPEPAIYLKTAEALGTAPANILFIDDREENIAAASALEFQTLHYTNHAAFEHEMHQRGLDSLLKVAVEREPATK
jgi:putative hydrolase of the HAD superfamily